MAKFDVITAQSSRKQGIQCKECGARSGVKTMADLEIWKDQHECGESDEMPVTPGSEVKKTPTLSEIYDEDPEKKASEDETEKTAEEGDADPEESEEEGDEDEEDGEDGD